MTRLLQIMAGAKVGGAENFFSRLALALHRAGIDQHIVSREGARLDDITKIGIPTSALRFGGKLDMRTKPRLHKITDWFKPDITLAWMSRAASFMPKPTTENSFLRVARLGGYYDLKYFQNCDHLIGNTQDICDYLIKEGWPKDRCWYLPNFVEDEYRPPLNRADYDTPQDVPLILCLGRLHENKGFDVAIKALVDVPRAYMWIAGLGPKEDELKALAKSLGVADRVRFLGWRDDVPALFSTADIFLCSSRHEPLGNMIIEAWAQSTPMVAMKSQGPCQLIIDKENGLLCELEDVAGMRDAINALINDPALGASLAIAGHSAYQESYTEGKVVMRYLDFFDAIVI
jgi:glycosyltransferase involved in cell wall biosynthesis